MEKTLHYRWLGDIDDEEQESKVKDLNYPNRLLASLVLIMKYGY